MARAASGSRRTKLQNVRPEKKEKKMKKKKKRKAMMVVERIDVERALEALRLPRGVCFDDLSVELKETLRSRVVQSCGRGLRPVRCPRCATSHSLVLRYFNNRRSPGQLQPRFRCSNPSTCTITLSPHSSSSSKAFVEFYFKPGGGPPVFTRKTLELWPPSPPSLSPSSASPSPSSPSSPSSSQLRPIHGPKSSPVAPQRRVVLRIKQPNRRPNLPSKRVRDYESESMAEIENEQAEEDPTTVRSPPLQFTARKRRCTRPRPAEPPASSASRINPCISPSTASTASASDLLIISGDREDEESAPPPPMPPAGTPESNTHAHVLYIAESLSSEGFADLVRTFDDQSLELLPNPAHGDFSAGCCTCVGDIDYDDDDDEDFFSLPIGHPSIASALGPTQLVFSL